jgi:glutamate racemase
VSDPRPIGVFDSGVGGLTVLREILRRLPRESTIYLGDNARAPYGPRPDEEVLAFSRQAIERLAERDVKAIVIACNTSTAIALADLRRRHNLPILGVIRPGAVTAALSTRNRQVGVIATSATVRSRAYFQAIKEENPAIEIYELATPALVPLVESGRLSGPEVEAIVRESLAGLLGRRAPDGAPSGPQPASAGIDTLLLGCTHYPLIEPAIRAVSGERIALVDSATATAGALADLLAINGLEAPGSTRGTAADPGRNGHDRPTTAIRPIVHRQLTTGSVDSFRDLAGRLFGDGFMDVEAIELGVPAG